jgi:hypothetical protein
VSQTRNWRITLWFLLLVALSTVGRAELPPPQPAPPLVFIHVTVIDATGTPPQPDMTVVISGDRIAEIGLTQHVRVPDEAHVVDATGKFLIPGLWDMHVHWYLKDFLPLFIANGVTGVRQMWGMPLHHTWRQDIERGTLLGPRMSIASPIVDGPNPIWPASMVVRNAAEGRQAVLLDANPLEDIRHTRAIRAVVLNGRLLDRQALDALLSQAEAAAQAVPRSLPDGVTIAVPAPDVPPAMAAFSGKWVGQWGQTLDHILVVGKIDGRTVTFIYSWGVAPASNITTPGFQRVHGTIGEDGVLRGTLGNGAEVAYTLSQDQQTLSGEYVLGGRTTRGRFTRQ